MRVYAHGDVEGVYVRVYTHGDLEGVYVRVLCLLENVRAQPFLMGSMAMVNVWYVCYIVMPND